MPLTLLNNWQPPPPRPDLPTEPHLDTPSSAYDLNFAGGQIPHNLQTDRVRLIPFIPILHARQCYKNMEGKKDVMRLMPYPKNMGESLDELLQSVELSMRSNNILFAIFDMTKKPDPDEGVPGQEEVPDDHPPLESMAGVIALFCDKANMTSEFGHIIIFPQAQRTHVLSHSVALLMHYALDHPTMNIYDPLLKSFVPPSPTSTRSALGLRRVQWQAHQRNATSIRSAERLGFTYEGIVRMHGTARGGDEEGREGDGAGLSRSNWVGSVTWRDWEEGGVKERMDRLVAR